LVASLLLLNNPLQILPSENINNLISSDYNFVLLPIFFGLIGSLFFLIDANTFIKKVIYNGLLLLFSLTIVLSGSRRGLIIFGCIIFILICIQIIRFIKPLNNLKIIAKRHRVYLFNIFLILILSYGLIFKTSYFYKKDLLEFLGSKDANYSSVRILASLFRYISPLEHSNDFYAFYENTWFANFDKGLDPDSGWGTCKHLTVYPLKGSGAKNIPDKARGYLLDSTCNSVKIGTNAYSYTLIGNQKVKKGDLVSATIFCYISEDFDASSVQFYSEGSTYETKVTEVTEFDSITMNEVQGKYPYVDYCDALELGKDNNLLYNGNFSDSTEYWEANADSTKHTLIKTPFGKGLRVSRTNGDGGWWSLFYSGPKIIYHAGHTYQIRFKFKVQKGSDLPFNIGWWVNDAGFYPFKLPIQIVDIHDGWKEAVCTYKFNETHYNLATFLNSLNDFSIVDFSDVRMFDLNKTDTLPYLIDHIGLINLSKRGVWRKFRLESKCYDGQAPVYISFIKRNTVDFSNLNGYIIFAYPKYNIISKDTLVEKSKFSNFYLDSISNNNTQDHNKFKNIQIQAGIFQSIFPVITILDKKYEDHDPIRNIAGRLIPLDTSYQHYKSDILIDTVSNKFLGDRIMRWEFAYKLFTKEYNLKHKIIGGGFSFLNWFGFEFEKDKSYIDYPHNPLLSVLLYSGLLGLFIFLIFICKVVKEYYKMVQDYFMFVIFFGITLFFSFFSAGSPFDPPIMGFFMLLPYLFIFINNNSLK
jgi:hypothetical protein